MRILIVCPYFPPENTIAAVRIAKFAEHWSEAGHDVRVLARSAVHGGMGVPQHPRLDVIRVADPLARAARLSTDLSSAPSAGAMRSAIASRLKRLAKWLAWPDVYAPWALRAWARFIGDAWRPDVVVASTGPFSALLLGSSLARRYRADLVVDYRDLLANGPYYEHGNLRRALDLRVEKAAASRACLIAGVSQPMVDELAKLHGRPSALITNGFDPSDFAANAYQPTSSQLRIVHCGTIYPGKRDITPLFRALRPLLDSDSESVRVDLYGRNAESALASAAENGVGHVVKYHGHVDHRESLRIQSEADVLVLLLWNDPREVGVLSGKIFEYMGARRPILMFGLETGAAAQLIRLQKLGLASNDVDEIREYLRDAIEQKRTTHRLQGPEDADLSTFTRRSQSAKFLAEIERATRGRTG